MTRVAGSSSQYSSRSLLETSALLPTLTKVDSPMSAVGRQREDRQPQRAALRRKPHGPGCRKQRRERRVETQRRTGVQQPHAIRPDHPHAVAAHAIHQLLLSRPSLVADFGVPGRDDHQRFDAGRRAVVHDGEDSIAAEPRRQPGRRRLAPHARTRRRAGRRCQLRPG